MSDARRGARRRDIVLLSGLALALVAMAWLAGFASSVLLDQAGPAVPEGVVAPTNFGLYDEAWSYVDREFYGETPQPRDVVTGAVTGLLESVRDPNAAFVDAASVATELSTFQPRYIEELGVWVEPTFGGLAVLAVVPDSVAAGAGIRAGDTVLAVDQTAIGRMERSRMIEVFRGEVGESSDLVVRDVDGLPESIEVERASTERPAVSLDRPGTGLFHLRIPDVTQDTLADMDGVLSTLADEPMDALIVDLRDNPGGDLDALTRLAGRFFEGTAWLEIGADGESVTHESDQTDAPGFAPPDHVVVLVNDGTVGAAEMLAAALRDRLGAEIVGTNTYGRDVLQDWIELSDGSYVRLSVSRWRTPNGTLVDDTGLVPDRVVEGNEAQLEAALAAFKIGSSASGG